VVQIDKNIYYNYRNGRKTNKNNADEMLTEKQNDKEKFTINILITFIYNKQA